MSRRLPLSDASDAALDQIFPDDFDWREMVRTYPAAALAVAAAVGFGLARSHGPGLVAALAALAGEQIVEHVRSAGG